MIRKYSKKSKLLLAALIITFSSNSQNLYPPKIQSPNAATLGTFGEVPVNLFTGTPDISIPLHTLSYGNINVPISLRYNSFAVKPGQHPGWVGSGWDLQSIGMISRQAKGPIDENYVSEITSGNFRSYYPYVSGLPSTFGSYYANLPNWYTSSQMIYDFVDHPGFLNIDVEADEFSFNVMGHSGKFYYEGSAGWKVVSDEKIKVELTDFFSPIEVVNAIKDHLSYMPGGCAGLSPSYIQSRMFSGFTLTVPDGTKYTFGGRKSGSGNPDAVELTSSRGLGSAPEYYDLTFTINTWLLKSITDVYGNTVTFSYASTYPTCNKFYTVTNYAATVYRTGCNSVFSGGRTFNKNFLTEIMQWPMYLSDIKSPNEVITFQMSNAVCNRYTVAQLSYSDQSNTATPDLEGYLLGSVCISWPNYLNNIQWQQLNTITVTDNPFSVGHYRATPNRIKKYKLNYSNNASQRLMLGSLQCLNKQDNVVEQYQFNYNTDFVTQSPGLHADGNFSDHWGFYNGLDLSVQNPDFSILKQSVPTKVTAELLNKITYPTGGYTSLIWEANDYSQVVKLDRQSLVSWQTYSGLNGYAGGSRIAEIKRCLSDGTVAEHKKYYYKSAFTAGVSPSSLPSSGVLNGIPVYTFSFIPTKGVKNDLTFGGSSTYLNSIGNYGYTGQGSPIGYSEVTEVNLDGSYTRNFFTNYDGDFSNVSNTHFDKAPLGSLGWTNAYNYFQFSSLELERGKPLGNFIYKPDNTLLQKTLYTYRNDAARFNEYVNLIEKTNEYDAPGGGSNCYGDILIFATARKVFTYSYYQTNKIVTTYDQNGGNPIVKSITLGYNSNNLVNARSTITSKGQPVVTNYTYTTEATDNVSAKMNAAHIYTPVIITTETKNSLPFKLTQTNYAEPYPGIFAPGNMQIKFGNNAIEIREKVNKYDTKGHVQEVQKTNGIKEVYLWGCNSQYIMAKIIGSDFIAASALVDQLKLDQAGLGSGGDSYTDADIREELNKLRTGLPNAMVTTYTYLCGVGLTSETDPAGRVTYYEYDSFNRLIDIRDQDFNLLKKFCYNYAGQIEDCSSTGFTNDLQQGTFTSTGTCPPGSSPGSLTYTVPAGTFTSFVDKPTANQIAIVSLNTNGQAAANLLPCTVKFSSVNTTTMPFNVVLTNTLSGAISTYTAYPGAAPVVLGNIPIGTYNLSVTPYSSASATLILNGITYTGTSFIINNLSINTATTITLQPVVAACSFSMAPGFSSPTSGITNNGSSISFYIVFYSTSSMIAGNSYFVGTITGVCKPSATRTITASAGGRSWTITINASGQMYWQMASGSATLNPNTTISTTTLTYNL